MDSQTNLFQKTKSNYQVKIKEFEGPLDLLLDLVKTSEINIYDINISEITKQYLDYMELLIEYDLDNMSEFIDMAATLILIKSRSMLPIEIDYDEDEEDPRGQLIAKLLEYQKYKIAAGLLDSMDDESVLSVRKNDEPMLFDVEEDNESNWRSLTVIDLITAFAKALNTNTEEDSSIKVTLLEFTVEDKITKITNKLKDKESFDYFELINEKMSKLEIVCLFLAILELVKKGAIAVKQHKIFGDIHIAKREEYSRPEEITLR
ncbi:MAG TPA: segregation/condensation protein A [Spirochaetota bacterium]|jgi:segregation and condensation protein A|nr:MAG: Segregation and condensation protein A [Spirochaetes bacterium ADurb.Bin133]HNZ26627.1 segregation/condensation protein A [Spirochaetota bacterium]HOF00949.1 segregation/condensation protein A [Spirochaetota bacterium]HOS33703.1 segregation/condensation protein A [Spirochaetota bacterium]HOS55205.1 segregation/condensation protein A [Spirochaetota bacterium]